MHGIRAILAAMGRLNMTLAIEEELLDAARAVAAERHTSVNEMVRLYLSQVVGEDRRRQAAWERIKGLVEQPPVVLGGPRPSRDELHER